MQTAAVGVGVSAYVRTQQNDIPCEFSICTPAEFTMLWIIQLDLFLIIHFP